ncbi:MAG: 3-oxoacyl-ACP synthase, partial [Halanaerobiales bacterium]
MTRKATIVGLGKYVPPKVLTNKDLEKMVETSDDWITSRTGIKERHIVEDDVSTSDIAYEAAQEALNDSGLAAEDIDLIIVATVTPDMAFPATACLIQERIGAMNASAFDLEAGCSGFVTSLSVAAQFIETGVYETALVIGAETLSK